MTNQTLQAGKFTEHRLSFYIFLFDNIDIISGPCYLLGFFSRFWTENVNCVLLDILVDVNIEYSTNLMRVKSYNNFALQSE